MRGYHVALIVGTIAMVLGGVGWWATEHDKAFRIENECPAGMTMVSSRSVPFICVYLPTRKP